MALVQSFATNFGDNSTAYHRVVALAVDVLAQRGRVTVVVYLDSTARRLDKEPIGRRLFDIEPTDFVKYFSASALTTAGIDPYKAAYLWLKGSGPYKSASDA